MNPFQVLGVAPTATMDEIEAAYRHQLRAHHPDLHQGGSPAELAEAEATTRSLNEAMALVRAGWRLQPGTAAGFHYDDRAWGGSRDPGTGAAADDGEDGAWNRSFRTAPDTDWFGNKVGPKRAESVDCPICGQIYTDPATFRDHLQRAHRIGGLGESAEAKVKVKRDRLAWLTWVPAPTFWLFVGLLIYWTIVVAALPTALAIVGIWLGVIGFGITLARAMRDRHRDWP
jgi:hypothetical protein